MTDIKHPYTTQPVPDCWCVLGGSRSTSPHEVRGSGNRCCSIAQRLAIRAAKHVALRSRQLDAFRKTPVTNAKWRESKASETGESTGSKESAQREQEASRENDAKEAAVSEKNDPRPTNTRQDVHDEGSKHGTSGPTSFELAYKQRQEALRASAERKDIPDGIDVNIFHTAHGSRILGSLRKNGAVRENHSRMFQPRSIRCEIGAMHHQ